MARPVEIDRDQAFSAASELFWRQGYVATSLQDLLAATDMGKGSFYAAFDSKEALFEAVLEAYQARSAASFERIRSEQQGLSAIRTFINRTLLDVSATNRRKGCMLVNTLLELEGVDDRLYRRAGQSLEHLKQTLRSCFEEARAAEELTSTESSEVLAGLLTSLLQGWRVESRKGISGSELRRQTTLFFDLVAAA